MSETFLATASEKQKWITQYLAEYVRGSRFSPYMGRSPTSIIFAKYELQNEAGKAINMPLITRLKSAGVTGSDILDGQEEELGNFNCPVTVDWRRNGVRVPKSTQFKTEIDLLNAARDMLKQWAGEKLRDDIIQAMLSVVIADTSGVQINGGATVNMVNSTSTQRNTYALNNADRLLFGKVIANYSATFATALGNLDTTNDLCTAASMSLAKRMAKNADPHIRPYQLNDARGEEFYVCFHGTRTFRDLKLDATMTQANREARAREGNAMDRNPIFQDGDLIYDGLIHREVPEIDAICTASGVLDGSGSSCDARPVFVCGQQAVAIAWGQEPTPRTDNLKDYQFRPGVAIEELLGVKKMAFNSKQHGIVTAFFAAQADG